MNHPRFQLTAADYPLLRPPQPAINPGSFIACPVALVERLPYFQQCWHSFLYQIAFAAAVEATRPSLPERDLLAVWN